MVVLRLASVMNVDQRIPILVAEDSEDNRFLLQAYCSGTPYDLTFAEDGEKAVMAFRAGDFRIVVMDIQMPVMDGLSATKEIRSLESKIGRKRTPILALTANVMPQDVVMAHQEALGLSDAQRKATEVDFFGSGIVATTNLEVAEMYAERLRAEVISASGTMLRTSVKPAA